MYDILANTDGSSNQFGVAVGVLVDHAIVVDGPNQSISL